jgi:hypothetical protein
LHNIRVGVSGSPSSRIGAALAAHGRSANLTRRRSVGSDTKTNPRCWVELGLGDLDHRYIGTAEL